jgi:NADH dehydrogenase
MTTSNRRHRVVIVGSGFGGLAAAKALRRAPVDLTVIDRTNHHLFQPLLYQMATGVVGAGDIAPPIRTSSAATPIRACRSATWSMWTWTHAR